jgi:hypothetical protein
MGRDERDDRLADAARRLEIGIARLKQGEEAPAWVCREVLDLTPASSWADVISQAVSKLALAQQLPPEGFRERALMVLMAVTSLDGVDF